MMNYLFIAIALLFVVYIYMSLKNKELPIEESVFWIIGSVVLLLLSIFYKSLDKLTYKLGIHYAPSFVFLIAIMFLLLKSFKNSKKILKQNEKIIELGQKLSILEYEVKELRKNKNDKEKNSKKRS